MSQERVGSFVNGQFRVIGNDVVTSTEEWESELTTAVTDAIMSSFEKRPMREITERETKRRYLFCLKIVKIARFECRNSIERICANIERWLLASIDGEDWVPEARRQLFAPRALRGDEAVLVGPHGQPIDLRS